MPKNLYVIDCCSLVYAWRDFYTPQSFPDVWKWIDRHIDDDLLLSHNEVYSELDFPEDLKDWAKDRLHIFTDAAPNEQQNDTHMTTT